MCNFLHECQYFGGTLCLHLQDRPFFLPWMFRLNHRRPDHWGTSYITQLLIYIRQDATLHSLFYLETALHISGGTSTHNQERKQLYLQHLVFVTPLLLPAAIAAGSSNGVTNTKRCRYSCLRSWLWVEVPPEICRAVSR